MNLFIQYNITIGNHLSLAYIFYTFVPLLGGSGDEVIKNAHNTDEEALQRLDMRMRMKIDHKKCMFLHIVK